MWALTTMWVGVRAASGSSAPAADSRGEVRSGAMAVKELCSDSEASSESWLAVEAAVAARGEAGLDPWAWLAAPLEADEPALRRESDADEDEGDESSACERRLPLALRPSEAVEAEVGVKSGVGGGEGDAGERGDAGLGYAPPGPLPLGPVSVHVPS
jgi:hypothetical protein